MPDRISPALAGLVLLAAGLDLLLLHTGIAMFLIRKLADLVEYLAFWR
jgi:hypothetical protein